MYELQQKQALRGKFIKQKMSIVEKKKGLI